MRHRFGMTLTALLVMAPSEARAEPYTPRPGEILHLQTPTTGKTDGGTDLRLPPGYFFDEPTHTTLDAEMRRLQERETRLAAENKSLRSSAKGISFGWYALAGALVTGFTVGVFVGK